MRLKQSILRGPPKITRSMVFKEESVFVGEITPMPGCSDVAVSHGMYCLRGKGKGNALAAAEMRMGQLRDLGYMAVICSVVDGNIAEEKTLIRAGFQQLFHYTSNRTENKVWIWGRSLVDGPQKDIGGCSECKYTRAFCDCDRPGRWSEV